MLFDFTAHRFLLKIKTLKQGRIQDFLNTEVQTCSGGIPPRNFGDFHDLVRCFLSPVGGHKLDNILISNHVSGLQHQFFLKV